MPENIDPARWEAFCDMFSKQHHGYEARIEMMGSSFGDQEMAAWLPFSGLSYDPHHAQLFITVGGISSHYPVHLTHRIDRPQTLAVHNTPEGQVSALHVVSEDKTETLVHLMPQKQLTA